MEKEIKRLQDIVQVVQDIVDGTPGISDISLDSDYPAHTYLMRVYLTSDPGGLLRDALAVEIRDDYPGAPKRYTRRKRFGAVTLIWGHSAYEEEEYRAKWDLPPLREEVNWDET